jgi:hypothetical protein
MHPSTTHPTLVAAKAVVTEITGLGIAASNRDYSNRIFGEEVTEQRFRALDQGLVQANEQVDVNTYMLLDAASIKAAAQLVAQHRAGNCQEQSALAFDKLARLGIRPLELMNIYNQNHVLVVAGRLSGTESTFTAWNEDTVICDAWAKRAYFVYALEDEMQTIRRVTNGETRMTQKFKLNRNAGW